MARYDHVEDDDSYADDPLTAELKSQLLHCLDRVDCTGSFAMFATYPKAVCPGLAIDSIGSIGLPLSDRDAKAIMKISHRAPFGKGSKTIVDTDVRKTWELNADQFSLENPSWDQTLQDILTSVATGLGVLSGIKAMRYKMLLYEEGAMFKPHKDSEKAPGMFGTLVICLPSEHEGGQICLTHGKREMLFDTAESSRFEFSYLAWYSDVTHEVKPVTKGYRFVLTYNLFHLDSGTRKLAGDLGNEKTELQNIISSWKTCYDEDREGCPNALAYMLNHKYTDANLGSSQLKGEDQLRLQYLSDVCKRNGILVFLSNLVRTIEGDCDEQYEEHEWRDLYFQALDGKADTFHGIREVTEESLHLTLVIDLDGNNIIRNIPLDECIIVQDEPFAGDPDEEDWSGPTGNEGVSATHFYHRTVAILIPSDHQVDFFFEACTKDQDTNPTSLSPLVQYLIEKSSNPANQNGRDELARLCRLIVGCAKERKTRLKHTPWLFHGKSTFSDNLLGKIVEASLHLQDLRLLSDIISALIFKLPPGVYSRMGNAVHQFGFTKMNQLLDSAVVNLKLHEIQPALDSILSGYKSSPGGGSRRKYLVAIKNWAREKTEDSLNAHEVSQRDGEALVELIVKDTEALHFQKVLSLVVHHVSNMSFALGFVTSVFDAGQKGTIAPNVVTDVFRTVLSGLVPAFTLDSPAGTNKRRKTTEPNWRRSLIKVEDVAALLHQCITLNLIADVDEILAKLTHCAENEDAFPTDLLTFLKHLCSILHNSYKVKPWDISSTPPVADIPERYRRFAQSILEACATRYIGAEPKPLGANWTRAARGCGCGDCKLLDRFLLDAKREVFSFAYADQSRREHLERQLRLEWGRSAEYETEKSGEEGSENRLVVRKREVKSPLLEEWVRRRSKAGFMVREIGNERQLRRLLAERYDELAGNLLAKK